MESERVIKWEVCGWRAKESSLSFFEDGCARNFDTDCPKVLHFGKMVQAGVG